MTYFESGDERMKRKNFSLVSLTICCVTILGIGCQKQASLIKDRQIEPLKVDEMMVKVLPSPEPGLSSPRITFENTLLDFGDVSPNTNRVGSYKFTNTGEAALKITEVKRCCGIITEWDKNKEYAPGESGVIKVKWKSGSQPNLFIRRPVIYSNDRINPATELMLRANTVQRISMEPKRLKLFLNEENPGCPNITLKSLDGRPFLITGFRTTANLLTADVDPSIEATEFVLEPKVDIEKINGSLSGRISVETTHPDGNSLTAFFEVLPKYTSIPSSIMLFSAEPGKPVLKKISVINNYGGEFEIDSVSSKNNSVGIKVVNKKKIYNGYQLEVEITPPDKDRSIRFMDEFSVNIKSGEKVAIRCNGGYFSKK